MKRTALLFQATASPSLHGSQSAGITREKLEHFMVDAGLRRMEGEISFRCARSAEQSTSDLRASAGQCRHLCSNRM